MATYNVKCLYDNRAAVSCLPEIHIGKPLFGTHEFALINGSKSNKTMASIAAVLVTPCVGPVSKLERFPFGESQ